MESRGYRFEFGLLVLLGCAIAAWHGEDRTPTHEVVELVSVVYKPARIVPSEQATTPVAATPVAKASCRPPGCGAKARSTTAAAKHAQARQARNAQPPLPAVLVPIRTLGLYLQDRLGTQQQEKPARKRQR